MNAIQLPHDISCAGSINKKKRNLGNGKFLNAFRVSRDMPGYKF